MNAPLSIETSKYLQLKRDAYSSVIPRLTKKPYGTPWRESPTSTR